MEVDLKPLSFELLSLLVERRGRAVALEALLFELWDAYYQVEVVKYHMSVLRRALRAAGVEPPITTVRRWGYRYDGE